MNWIDLLFKKEGLQSATWSKTKTEKLIVSLWKIVCVTITCCLYSVQTTILRISIAYKADQDDHLTAMRLKTFNKKLILKNWSEKLNQYTDIGLKKLIADIRTKMNKPMEKIQKHKTDLYSAGICFTFSPFPHLDWKSFRPFITRQGCHLLSWVTAAAGEKRELNLKQFAHALCCCYASLWAVCLIIPENGWYQKNSWKWIKLRWKLTEAVGLSGNC